MLTLFFFSPKILQSCFELLNFFPDKHLLGFDFSQQEIVRPFGPFAKKQMDVR